VDGSGAEHKRWWLRSTVVRIVHGPVGNGPAIGEDGRMTFERTDFVSVPVQDMARAKAFYRDTLQLHSPNWDDGWPEIETGNVSLYLVDPTALGGEFSPHSSWIALRVHDVPESKAELEGRGVTFSGEHDTGVCKMAFFNDSEGNALMLHRRYAP
jgi:catechol 2,3-dioxygenase-like lactoylglutathione lyase family enzyme